MAVKKSVALEFTRNFLRRKPDASFAEIRDAAADEDLKIYPIVFGRAKALEGLVKVAPYGSKKKAKAARETAALANSLRTAEAGATHGAVDDLAGGPPQEDAADAKDRPQSSSHTTVDSIHAVINGMRENHEHREKYRAALIRISEILDEVL